MKLHGNELEIDEALVARLIGAERPDLADRTVREIGGGTDNRMFAVGDDLVARMPRTVATSAALRKEREWLPRLAPRLSLPVPSPVHDGSPGAGYPAPWALVRWLEGAVVAPGRVDDWAGLGRDLAGFVADLHGIELMGARREGALSWYRGGPLADCDGWVGEAFDEAAELDTGLDVDLLRGVWAEGLALPASTADPVWLHGDLKPTNLLIRDGRLSSVIDFGALSIGLPDAEHATIWDLPRPARDAYRAALDLDDPTWIRARAWATAVGISGVTYYWHTFPAFVAECLARLRRLSGDDEHDPLLGRTAA